MLYNTSPDTAFKPTSQIDPLGYGKVAVVTGCGSGIGLATTQLLLAHQFRVCGLDARDFDYQLLRVEDHGRFHFTKADLAASGACEQAVRVCVAAFGTRIDVLVNVAGVMDNFASADGVTDEDWDRVLTVNLTVPVKMMRGVIPFMTAVSGGRDGAIINVASTAGVSGAVAGVAYTASKHGLVSILFLAFVSEVKGGPRANRGRFRSERPRMSPGASGTRASGVMPCSPARWTRASARP